jgi:DNA-binding transcriptional LysR family regulator
MDFGQLKTIIQVAETGSLLRASERLGIAQPALSRQVRQLEEELGAPLFMRHGRGMALTPFGIKTLARARAILDEVAAIRGDAETFQSAPTEEVVLGLPPNVAELLIVPVLRRFAEAYPKVRLRLVSAYSGHLQEWLIRGEIDLALIYEQNSAQSVTSRALVLETLFFVASGKRGLSRDVPFSFPDIVHEKLVLPSPKHRLRLIVSEAAQQCDIALNIVHEADDLFPVRDVVAADIACSVLPFPAIHAQVAQRLLSAAPLVDPTLTRRLDLVFATQRPLGRAGKALCRVIVDEVKELIEAGVWAGQLLE